MCQKPLKCAHILKQKQRNHITSWINKRRRVTNYVSNKKNCKTTTSVSSWPCWMKSSILPYSVSTLSFRYITHFLRVIFCTRRSDCILWPWQTDSLCLQIFYGYNPLCQKHADCCHAVCTFVWPLCKGKQNSHRQPGCVHLNLFQISTSLD